MQKEEKALVIGLGVSGKSAARFLMHLGYDVYGFDSKDIEIEFLEPIILLDDDGGVQYSSTNPAIWETEPKEVAELDLYYEASNAYAVADHGNEQALDYHNCYSFANGVDAEEFPKVFLLLTLSNLLLFNLFAFGNALSLNKGAMLGILSTLPLTLPVIILLGRAVRTIQFGEGFFEILILMIGISLLVTAIMPLIISAALKTHLD